MVSGCASRKYAQQNTRFSQANRGPMHDIHRVFVYLKANHVYLIMESVHSADYPSSQEGTPSQQSAHKENQHEAAS